MILYLPFSLYLPLYVRSAIIFNFIFGLWFYFRILYYYNRYIFGAYKNNSFVFQCRFGFPLPLPPVNNIQEIIYSLSFNLSATYRFVYVPSALILLTVLVLIEGILSPLSLYFIYFPLNLINYLPASLTLQLQSKTADISCLYILDIYTRPFLPDRS